MSVSEVFALGGDWGGGSGLYSGPNSYDNFGCNTGDCYAGDYGRYSHNYYDSFNGGLRNASATRGRGYDQVQG
ncbi:MAG: hypothetical protein WCC38_13965 [Pseudonocardiaceae bacterium]